MSLDDRRAAAKRKLSGGKSVDILSPEIDLDIDENNISMPEVSKALSALPIISKTLNDINKKLEKVDKLESNMKELIEDLWVADNFHEMIQSQGKNITDTNAEVNTVLQQNDRLKHEMT